MMLSVLAAIALAAQPVPPQPEQPKPQPVITGIEGATVTLAPGDDEKLIVKLEKVKTPQGARIRITSGHMILEATRLEIHVGRQVHKIFIDPDGLMLVDSFTLPAAPLAPAPRPKQP